jgi:hypothetical protein
MISTSGISLGEVRERTSSDVVIEGSGGGSWGGGSSAVTALAGLRTSTTVVVEVEVVFVGLGWVTTAVVVRLGEGVLGATPPLPRLLPLPLPLPRAAGTKVPFFLSVPCIDSRKERMGEGPVAGVGLARAKDWVERGPVWREKVGELDGENKGDTEGIKGERAGEKLISSSDELLTTNGEFVTPARDGERFFGRLMGGVDPPVLLAGVAPDWDLRCLFSRMDGGGEVSPTSSSPSKKLSFALGFFSLPMGCELVFLGVLGILVRTPPGVGGLFC